MAHHKIEKLYKQIPSFKCKEGCADCCGIIPWARSEWEPIADKREQTSEHCPYIDETGRCEVYYQRPFMCRLYGAADDSLLRCPKGCGPEKPLSWEKAQKLTNKYHLLINK